MSGEGSAVNPMRVVVRIFVASPKDVDAERHAVADVAREHNERHGVYHGYVLDAELFEKRVSPGFGAPEEVIYKRMGHPSAFHIVVGILASTVGTPDHTDKSRRSGTQQELDAAMAACRASGRPEVMLYLKQSTGAGVEAYAQQLTGKLLRARYPSAEEFRDLFDKDLLLKTYEYILPLVIDAKGRDPSHVLRARMSQYWFGNKGAFRDVLRPAEVPMRVLERGAAVVESTSSIDEVYQHAVRGLTHVAVVGRRGSGKSFTLFELIWLAMASPEANRVPVYLAATDWLPRAGGRGRSMQEWLQDELHSTYKLKRSGKASAQTLIEKMKVMPFVDGMDELLEVDSEDSEGREARFEEFKAMLSEWSQRNPLAVACEASTWDLRAGKLQEKFTLVAMLPFEEAAASLADRPELERIVRGNAVMQQLCKTPLAISLLRRIDSNAARTLRNLEGVLTEADGVSMLMQNAFEGSSPEDETYPRDVRERALAHIAKRLQPGESFEIEQLQPADFGVERRYRVYAGLGLALVIFVLVAVPSFLSLVVERYLAAAHQLPGYIAPHPILESLFGASLAGAVGGLVIFVGMLFSRGWLGFGVAVGTAFGCARGAVLGVGLTDDLVAVAGLDHGLWTAFITSAAFSAVMCVIFRIQKLDPARIRPFDVSLGDVRQQFMPAAYRAVPAGLAVGALFGLLFDAARGISFGIMVAIVVETIIVVASRPTPRKVRPNQGIRVSAEASLKIGGAALIAGPVCFGLGYLNISVESAIVNAILGMNVGLIVLLCGGLPVVQHYALRAALYRRKIMPFWMVKFCEECVHLGMLKRAGHRYRFAHEYVRRYFAGDTPEKL